MKKDDLHVELNRIANAHVRKAYEGSGIRYFDKELIPREWLDDKGEVAAVSRVLREYVNPAVNKKKEDVPNE